MTAYDPSDVSWLHVDTSSAAALNRGMLQLLDPDTPESALRVLFDAFADSSVHEFAYFHPQSTVGLRRYIRDHFVSIAGESAFDYTFPAPDTATAQLSSQWWTTRHETLPEEIRSSEEVAEEQAQTDSMADFGLEAALGTATRVIDEVVRGAESAAGPDDWEAETEGWFANFMDLIQVYPKAEVRNDIDLALALFGGERGDVGAYGWLRGFLDGYITPFLDSAPVKATVTDSVGYLAGHREGWVRARLAKGDTAEFERWLDEAVETLTEGMGADDAEESLHKGQTGFASIRRLLRDSPTPRSRDLVFAALAKKGLAESPINTWATHYVAGYTGEPGDQEAGEFAEAAYAAGVERRADLDRFRWWVRK